MDNLKLKIEIGDRRFEADGPVDVVSAHVSAFMKMAIGGNAGTIASETPEMAKAEAEKARAEEPTQGASTAAADSENLRLDSIISVDGADVVLNKLPGLAADSVVALMLGHRILRNNHVVSGGEIVRGLSASGRPTNRASHLLNLCRKYGWIQAVGKNRGRRYLLTNAGVKRAEAVAHVLINALPKD